MTIHAAALDVALRQMVRDGVEHARGYLRAGGVVEEDEVLIVLQAGELPPQRVDGKSGNSHGR